MLFYLILFGLLMNWLRHRLNSLDARAKKQDYLINQIEQYVKQEESKTS